LTPLTLYAVEATEFIECGTKTNELLKLQRLGIKVPQFLVVDISGYRALVDNFNIPSFSDFIKNKQFEPKISNSILDLTGKINIIYPNLLNSSIIVRSSSAVNTHKDQYFASIISGAFESYECSIEDLVSATLKVYASLYSERAYSQLRCIDLKSEIIGMTILIQNAINPKCSGVLHYYHETQNIETTWVKGHLRDIVSGKTSGMTDSLNLNINGSVVVEGFENHIYTIIENSFEQPFSELYFIANKIGKFYNKNLEIEWLYDGSDISIVQCQELIIV
jgi:phosphoenolpyruvate synthase/pyruvate phosphate dikinase